MVGYHNIGIVDVIESAFADDLIMYARNNEGI